ncbi:MAG: HlyC/CorC family transporter [Acidobacteria bacterium]|nr:HlyC/CorC family transporter [Acidobacteriota bacterium]
MVTYVLLRIFLILLLVAVNAFFAAAEFALVSVRDTRIQQLIQGRRIGARIVQRLHQNIDQVINGVQLGITVTSLTLGWVGEPILAHVIEQGLGLRAVVYAHTIAVAITFACITYLHVILGELVPKSLALQRAERVALAVAAPMDIFLTITRPFLFLMLKSGNFVLRMFGSRELRRSGRGVVHSPDELKLIVTASRRFGEIPEFQEEMIHNVLELDDTTVREVMVPRPDIFSLPADLPLEAALERVVSEQHSRIPIYDPQRGPEHIVGVLYVRDLMRWMRLRLAVGVSPPRGNRIGKMQVGQIMRNVLVVPETKVLTDMLLEFKEHRRHLAVVVDEFGSTAGVITIEDMVAQLMGRIQDEFDVLSTEPALADAAVLLVEGSTSLRDLETEFEITLPRDGGFETLAGFVLARMQKIPRAGEAVEFEGRRFTVDEMDDHRVAKVKIEKLGKAAVMQQAGD